MNPSDNIAIRVPPRGGKRAFITGISGFAGSHLAEVCLAEGLEVSGLSRRGADEAANMSHFASRVTMYRGDLSDGDRLRSILHAAAADYLFHLAAETTATTPGGIMFATTVSGTANLLLAAAGLAVPPRVLIAGSSAVYGSNAHSHVAIDEAATFNPVSLYGMTKASQDLIAEQLGAALGLSVVRTRAFNHTGPRERADFVASSVASQLATMEANGVAANLAVGRMDALRDFSDVRDIAYGYYLAISRGTPGDAYNLASGVAVSIGDIVARLISLSSIPVAIEYDGARSSPADVNCQIGDASKARRELNWQPRIGLDQSLSDLLNYWRKSKALKE